MLGAHDILIYDSDTLRRLVRLDVIDVGGAYPVRELLDGFPVGSVSHWTLPMDWVIRALDPMVSWIFPVESGYEAGAILTGPLLALLSTLVLMLGCRRIFGPSAALVAGLIHAGAYSVVNVSMLGNGDHQNLQHLCVLAGLMGLWVAIHENKESRGLGAGAALGLAIWVSAESMTIFYLLAASLFVLVAWPAGEGLREARRRLVWRWSTGLLAVMLLGHLAEHVGDLSAFHWDVLSLFQIYQVAVFALFAGFLSVLSAAGWVRVMAVAAMSLMVGLVPILVSDGLRGAIALQFEQVADLNVWLQNEVSEYRSLWSEGFGAMIERDSFLIIALPLFLMGLIASRALGAPLRSSILLMALATFGLELWEVKLGHLFAMTFPVAVVGGYLGLRERFRPSPGGYWGDWLAVVVAVFAVALSLPSSRDPVLFESDRATRQICKELRQRSEDLGWSERSVLAPWDMGAEIMYRARLPVVASGYHRNIEGIRDGYRVFLAGRDQREEAQTIIDDRKVGWVVAWYSRDPFLEVAPLTIGRPSMGNVGEFTAAAKESLFWQLRYQGRVPGLRLYKDGPVVQLSTGKEPMYRIFEVVR